MASMSREEIADNGAAANAEISKALSDDFEKPVVPLPPSDLVTLPGGYMYQGEVVRTVQVRELNGSHEEALARALQPPPGSLQTNWASFLTVLLECGTERFGDLDEDPSELLKDTLLGDRDAIILGIRRATYGDEVELKGWQCPACQGVTDVAISLTDDVEVTRMADVAKASTFEVALTKGRSATVRLATGRDLTAMWELEGLNKKERDSIMLSRCLVKVTDAAGVESRVQGRGAAAALSMSLPDRNRVIRELEKRQPGPRYNEIKFAHQDCRQEVPLRIGLGDLFPDLF